mmetsp:Transcript_5801/g.22134  ORF Transcript_5801/g.22134 Transcript_5801/m.22134 type:complete len:543 (+) Transcript_5801:45-1673(+)
MATDSRGAPLAAAEGAGDAAKVVPQALPAACFGSSRPDVLRLTKEQLQLVLEATKKAGWNLRLRPLAVAVPPPSTPSAGASAAAAGAANAAAASAAARNGGDGAGQTQLGGPVLRPRKVDSPIGKKDGILCGSSGGGGGGSAKAAVAKSPRKSPGAAGGAEAAVNNIQRDDEVIDQLVAALEPLDGAAGQPEQDLDLDRSLLEVAEVEGKPEKEAACALHLAKPTFDPERELVKRRVFRGDDAVFRCRTWILRHPTPSSTSSSSSASVLASAAAKVQGGALEAGGVLCLAAVTVRINAYQRRCGRWAQILNMSSLRERQGLGTLLIAGMEELLRKEDVDVVVLYPAWNGRAAPFWASLGFCPCGNSYLPDEELIPFDKGGPLLPEYEASRNDPLPRWEKHITGWSTSGMTTRGSSASKLLPHRSLPASLSRLSGTSLLEAADKLLKYRRELQEEFQKAPRKFPNGLPDVVAQRNNGGTKRFTPSAKAAALLAKMRGGGRRANLAQSVRLACAAAAKSTGVGVDGLGGAAGGRGRKRKVEAVA